MGINSANCLVRLDVALNMKFRDAINSSPTIPSDESFSDLYNLSCAVMDRLDTAVKYLNSHWDYPESEEDFLCFLLFACMLNDGVDSIYKRTIGDSPKCNEMKKYFKQYCMGAPAYFSEEECPTDEGFFEHFRSLTFAHPYETSRNKAYKNKFGTQVSPWVVVNKNTLPSYKYPEPVGVRIYSTNRLGTGDIYDIMFPFAALKGYLVEKHTALNEVTDWINNLSEKTFVEWKNEKVNRKLSKIDILKDICRILNKRHESIYEIKTIIDYLDCHITDMRNLAIVNEYREYLISLIPELCDSVDNLDSAGQYESERKCSVFYPLNLHQMAHYQIEKIFNYLSEKSSYVTEGSDEEWGLKQAENFYEEFAKKWVYMDVYSIEYTEIKLLVTVALYKEAKEQGRLSVR